MPLNREAQMQRDLEDLRRTVRELQAAITPSITPVVQSVVVAQSTADTAQSNAVVAQQSAVVAQQTADTATGVASSAQSAAQQASSDASAANTNASNASAAAQAAQQQAQTAQQVAAAKTKTTWSTSTPDNTANPGTADGDVWFVTNGTGGAATAQYRWSASSSTWTLTPINGSVLQNVVADTVKVGAIDGQTVTGALIRSAASGQRVEVSGQSMRVYGATGDVAAALQGVTNAGYAAIALQASSSAGAGACIVVGPTAANMPSAATPTARYDVLTYAGIATPDVFTSRLYAGTRPAFSGQSPQSNRLVIERVDQAVNIYADDFRTADGKSIVSADTGWTSPTVTGSGFSVNTLRIRKIGNRVQWVGQLNRSSNISSGGIGTVPTAYAPSLPGGGSRQVIAVTATAGTQLRIAFYPDGRFEVLDVTGGTSTYAIFDGVSYLTD